MIRTNEEILKQMAVYTTEQHNGIECGLSNLDNIIRLDKKRFTIVTSTANMGKTTFINYYCYKMAQTHKLKTLFLSFENDEDLFYYKLKKTYMGNEFVNYSRYLPFLECNFRNLDDIFKEIEEYRTQWGFDILVIDPMESLQLYMNNNYRSEDYANVLERIRQYTKDKNIITILAAHQRKPLAEGEEPTIFGIFGSISFANKADNIIGISQIKQDNPQKTPITKVTTLKIRHNFTEGRKGETAYFGFIPIYEHFQPIEETEINDFDWGNYALQVPNEKAKNEVLELQKQVFEIVTGAQEMAQESTQPQPIDNIKAEQTKELENANKAFLNDTKVSLYNNFKYVQDMTLSDALTMGNDYAEQITKCRTLKNQGESKENEYKEEKRKLPSYTATATYKGERIEENRTSYNGLAVIDLDDLEDVEKAKEDVKQLPFVLYAAKSVGGKGLFCVVRLNGGKDDYKVHWYALKDDFQSLGYKVDESCKDVSRLRFISYDENPYINYKATIYTKTKEITHNSTTLPLTNGNETNKLTPKEQQVLNEIIADVQTNHLVVNKNHSDTLYIGNILSSILGEDGRKYAHILRQQRRGYDSRKIDYLYDYCTATNTTRYTMGALRKLYNDAKTRK